MIDRVLEVGVTEFRTNLPLYIKKVAGGAVVNITHHGRQIARMLPPEQPVLTIPVGALTGKIIIPADFDEIPLDIYEAMTSAHV